MRVLMALGVGLALLAVTIVLVGQVLPGSETLKIVYAVALLVGAGLVLGRLVKPRPALRVPMRVATVGAGVVLLGWWGLSQRDTEVSEQLIQAPAPAGSATATGTETAPEGGEQAEDAAAGPRTLASGRFVDLDHPGAGEAEIVETEGERVLQLRDFETDPGPDLRVYLATDSDAEDFADLGELKGNQGDQRYDVPADADLDRLDTVVVWCRAFTVAFTAAALEEQ